jgi:hypothetical protein
MEPHSLAYTPPPKYHNRQQTTDQSSGIYTDPYSLSYTRASNHRTPSPVQSFLLDSGRNSPLKTFDAAAYLSRYDVLTKTPSKAKRESAALIAQRRWKTSKHFNKAYARKTPDELRVMKFSKEKPVKSEGRSRTRLTLQGPEAFKRISVTITPKTRMSRVEADELVWSLLQNKHDRYYNVMQTLKQKAPARLGMPGRFSKSIQSD